jgi:hypothetical protein
MATALPSNTILGLGLLAPCTGAPVGLGTPVGCGLGPAHVPVGISNFRDALHPVLVMGSEAVIKAGSPISVFDLTCADKPRRLGLLGETVIWEPVQSLDGPHTWVPLPALLTGPAGVIQPRAPFLLARADNSTMVMGSTPSDQLRLVNSAAPAGTCVTRGPVHLFFAPAVDTLSPSFALPTWVPQTIVYQFPDFWPRPLPDRPWNPWDPPYTHGPVGGQRDSHGCLVAAGESWVNGRCCQPWNGSCYGPRPHPMPPRPPLPPLPPLPPRPHPMPHPVLGPAPHRVLGPMPHRVLGPMRPPHVLGGFGMGGHRR